MTTTAKTDKLVNDAACFAQNAHRGQFRKYDQKHVPYIIHPARVAAAVMEEIPDHTLEMVAAAWLHDVVEDTPVTLGEIHKEFGQDVTKLVWELTNPSKGSNAPRGERKKMDRDHLETVSKEAKQIKLLDRIDNLLDMAGAPKDFEHMYKLESIALAVVLYDASPSMSVRLQKLAGAI